MQTRGYREGDRLYYRNQYGQDFYATITGVLVKEGKLRVKRTDWPRDEVIDLDDYVRSHTFPRQPV
jgi:hypothetical protein